MVQRIGRGCYLSKIDITAAFRLLPVRPDQWDKPLFKWKEDYYFETRFPFGLRSAPSIFETVSTALEWIVKSCCGASEIIHYLDDFLLGASTESLAREQASAQLRLFDSLGVPWSEKKNVIAVTHQTDISWDWN